MNISITPSLITERGAPYLLVQASIVIAEETNTSDVATITLFKNNDEQALASSVGELWHETNKDGGTADAVPFQFMFEVSRADAGRPMRLSIRAGLEQGVININGAAGRRVLGGSLVSSMTVTELLGEPTT